MGDQLWEATRLLGRILWQHGFWGIVTSTLWGLLFGVLGVVISLALWGAARRRGWLVPRTADDPWVTGGVLALWLLFVPATLGLAGMAWGAERATLAAMHEERIVEHACRGAATAVTEPAVRLAAAHAGLEIAADEPCPRVPMREVWALREHAHETVAAIERNVVEEHIGDADDVMTDAQRFAARRTLAYVRELALAEEDERLAAYLRDVERHAAQDGTVAVEDFVTVLARDVLEPHADALVASAFAGLRWPLYLTALGVLALPLGVLALLRWHRRRTAAATTA